MASQSFRRNSMSALSASAVAPSAAVRTIYPPAAPAAPVVLAEVDQVAVPAALEEVRNSDVAENQSGVDASARNWNPRISLATRLWMRQFLKAKSSSSAVLQHKKFLNLIMKLLRKQIGEKRFTRVYLIILIFFGIQYQEIR